MALATSEREFLVGACRLFGGVDETGPGRRRATRPSRSTFPAERVIARQGEIGSGLFIIADGSVRVVRDGRHDRALGPGEFFGELSVLDGAPRNAQRDRARSRRPASRSPPGTPSASCASSPASPWPCSACWPDGCARRPPTTAPSAGRRRSAVP